MELEALGVRTGHTRSCSPWCTDGNPVLNVVLLLASCRVIMVVRHMAVTWQILIEPSCRREAGILVGRPFRAEFPGVWSNYVNRRARVSVQLLVARPQNESSLLCLINLCLSRPLRRASTGINMEHGKTHIKSGFPCHDFVYSRQNLSLEQQVNTVLFCPLLQP